MLNEIDNCYHAFGTHLRCGQSTWITQQVRSLCQDGLDVLENNSQMQSCRTDQSRVRATIVMAGARAGAS